MTPREIADAILSGDMKGPHHEAYGKALSRALIKVHGERDAAVKRADEAEAKLARIRAVLGGNIRATTRADLEFSIESARKAAE